MHFYELIYKNACLLNENTNVVLYRRKESLSGIKWGHNINVSKFMTFRSRSTCINYKIVTYEKTKQKTELETLPHNKASYGSSW